MNEKINDLLDKIEEIEKEYGKNIYTQIEKANESEIKFFNDWIVKYLENGFSEYIDFIKVINGLNFNGLYIYSLNKKINYNIYESNEIWRENELGQYIFFADDDISWYCFNRNNGKYYLLDKPSGDIMNEYKTFDEIIIRALKISLYIDDE
ncbi:MAG: YrhA family protein [Helicobacteraceae bacterium]|jgi:hypothetical protein|nr:YrhA family protein [Helicobacteraceae bacterium]